MISLSIIGASMATGFQGGLIRFPGMIPMSLLCMMIMYLQGRQLGLRCYYNNTLGQAIFLAFFVLAPSPLIYLWYLLEPGLALLGFYCVARIIHVFARLTLYEWQAHAARVQVAGEMGVNRVIPLDPMGVSLPKLILCISLCGTAEMGGSLFQNQLYTFAGYRLYPLLFVLTYVLVPLLHAPIGTWLVENCMQRRWGGTRRLMDREQTIFNWMLYTIIGIFGQTQSHYIHGLYLHRPLQYLGVPDTIVPFHEVEDYGIMQTWEAPESPNMWYGPCVLPADKEEQVNQHREESLTEETYYHYEEQYQLILYTFWEYSIMGWFVDLLHLIHLTICTPPHLWGTLLRGKADTVYFWNQQPPSTLITKGFGWHPWYFDLIRPGQPEYARSLRRSLKLVGEQKFRTRLEQRLSSPFTFTSPIFGKVRDFVTQTFLRDIPDTMEYEYDLMRRVFVARAKKQLLLARAKRTKTPVTLESLSDTQRAKLDELAYRYGTKCWKTFLRMNEYHLYADRLNLKMAPDYHSRTKFEVGNDITPKEEFGEDKVMRHPGLDTMEESFYQNPSKWLMNAIVTESLADIDRGTQELAVLARRAAGLDDQMTEGAPFTLTSAPAQKETVIPPTQLGPFYPGLSLADDYHTEKERATFAKQVGDFFTDRRQVIPPKEETETVEEMEFEVDESGEKPGLTPVQRFARASVLPHPWTNYTEGFEYPVGEQSLGSYIYQVWKDFYEIDSTDPSIDQAQTDKGMESFFHQYRAYGEKFAAEQKKLEEQRIKREAEEAKREAEKAKREAEKAKREAEKAKRKGDKKGTQVEDDDSVEPTVKKKDKPKYKVTGGRKGRLYNPFQQRPWS